MWKIIFVGLLLCSVPARARLYDDPGFGTAGYRDIDLGGSQYLYDAPELRVLPDRRIVAAAMLVGLAPQLPTVKVVRLLPDGAPDPAFASNGVASIVLAAQPVDWGSVTSIVPLADGGLFVLGYTMRLENPPDGSGPIYHQFAQLIRLRVDGSVDSGFNGGQAWTGDALLSGGRLFVQGGGVLLVAMSGYCCSSSGGFEARRFRADGTLDPAFGAGGVLSVPPGDSFSAAAMALPGGGFQVLNYQRPVAGQPLRNYWRRYRADGSVDVAYGNGGVQEIALTESYGITHLFDLGDGTQLGAAGGCAMRWFDTEGRVLTVLPRCSIYTPLANARVQHYGAKWLFSGEQRFGGVPPPSDGTYLHVTDRGGSVDAGFAAPQDLRWRPPDAPNASYAVAADGDAHVVIARGNATGLRIRRYRDIRGGDPFAVPVPALAPEAIALMLLGLLAIARPAFGAMRGKKG